MLRELNRHNLDYEKALAYFKDQLNPGHALSTELLNYLDFKNGQFFTLLPVDADLNRIYDFFGGLILPQNPTHTYINELGKKSSYTWIPTLKKEMSAYIYQLIQLKYSSIAVFEDVLHRPEDTHLDFFNQYGLLYLNQMYYLLNKNNGTPEVIESAIGEADALWHLLFILAEIESSDSLEKELTLEKIKEFARNTKLLVLGAYDDEGYVLWEPNSQIK